jgi:hypothetical protein
MIFLERVERKNYVFRGYRLAVMPLRLGPQAIGDRRKILRMAKYLRQRTIFGRNFVQRRRRQRFINELDWGRYRALDPGNRDIQVVEGPDQNLADDATLGRVRIDVIEVFEVGWIFDVAEQRQGVPPGQPIRCGLRMRGFDGGNAYGKPQRRGHRGDSAALQKMSSGNRQMKNSCLLTPARAR